MWILFHAFQMIQICPRPHGFEGRLKIMNPERHARCNGDTIQECEQKDMIVSFIIFSRLKCLLQSSNSKKRIPFFFYQSVRSSPIDEFRLAYHVEVGANETTDRVGFEPGISVFSHFCSQRQTFMDSFESQMLVYVTWRKT